MKIIVPMAGLGTRFQKAADTNPEYKKAKPFINVKGNPMVCWALASLPFFKEHKDVIFIVLHEHNKEYKMEKVLKEIYSPDIKVIVLPKVTRGAAETAYSAKDFIDPEEDVLITDSDHFFDGKNFAETIRNKRENTSGVIPVFKARNEGIPKWSYTLTHPDSNVIVKVAEKDRQLMEAGAYANIGAYYFSKAKTFFDEAQRIIEKNLLTGDEGKKEFYIAPMYQNLIEQGHSFEVAIIPEMWGLGTPSDLEYFLLNCKHKGI